MQTLNIYVAHPYDGHEENKKKVEEFIKLLIKKKVQLKNLKLKMKDIIKVHGRRNLSLV